MTKIHKFQTNSLPSGVLDFPILDVFVSKFVSDFEIRISYFFTVILTKEGKP